jgi:hypothetical protein
MARTVNQQCLRQACWLPFTSIAHTLPSSLQVSGLRSITAKHLAVSCQCLGAFMALHPALLALFTQGVAPPRLAMLTADFGRALQARGYVLIVVQSKLSMLTNWGFIV